MNLFQAAVAVAGRLIARGRSRGATGHRSPRWHAATAKILGLVASFMLLGAVPSRATVYSVSVQIGTGQLTGTIQTDGTIGTLATSNIVNWDLTETSGTSHFEFKGSGNSKVVIVGSSFTATATALSFNFGSSTDYAYVTDNISHFICLNGTSGACDFYASGFDFDVGSQRSVQSGSVQIAGLAAQLQVSPATGISASGSQGGPFSPSSFQYQLTASSGSVGYSISGVPSWLTASSTSGTVTTSGTTVTFSVNSNANSLTPATYNATVTFTDTTNNLVTETVTAAITVSVKNGVLQVSPATSISTSGNQGGPFSPSSFQYQLSASQGSVSYSIAGVPSWLTASSTSGTVTTSATTVTFTVNTTANNLSPGSYRGTISFNDTTNNNTVQTTAAALTVNGGTGGSSANIYVSAKTGSDTGACSITAPCATLNYALSVADVGATITILDGGVFGPVVLTHAITITGTDPDLKSQIVANPTAQVGCIGALPSGCGLTNNGYGVEIAAGPTDNVNIDNLSLTAGSTGNGALKFTSGGQVQLRDDVFLGNNTATGATVELAPNNAGTTQAQVYFSKSDVGFNNGGAIEVKPSGSTSFRLQMNNVEVHNAQYGLRADASLLSGSSVNLTTLTADSKFFSFTSDAATAYSTSGGGLLNSAYNNMTIVGSSGAAITSSGPQSYVFLTGSTISGNTIGVQTLSGGYLYSLVNNTVSGNGTNVSGALTPQPLQ